MEDNINKSLIKSDFQMVVSDVLRVQEFIKFAMWSATPRQFREPETQKEFAETIGVCQDTLTDWKHHPQFRPLVQQAMTEWIKERVPDVIGALYDGAMAKGKAGEVLTFLRVAGVDLNNDKNK